MKRTLLLILAIILTLSVAGIAIASDITGAEYKTTIAVTNNSTATTSVAVPFTLSTSEMIDVGMLSANASDAAMISSGGSDTAFMPSSDNSHPWITWLSSIGTDSQVLQFLYSKGASGGEIRYFPDDAGMSANDSATLELADNFTIEQKGWVDTAYSANKSLVHKPNAFSVNVTASGNITAFSPIEAWTSPDSYVDNGAWADEIKAYNGNTGDYAQENIGGIGWSNSLELHLDTPILCNEIRFWYSATDAGQFDLDAYYNSGWNHISEGAEIEAAWVTKSLSDNYSVSAARIRVYSGGAGGLCNLHELEFWHVGDRVTATGTSSGEHTVRTTANVTHLMIYVDDMVTPKDITALTANVTDTPANWTYCSGGSMPYMEYTKVTINGTLQQHIEWEYNAVEFTDLSGNSHNVDPTFRTMSSNANISAEVSQQEGLITGSTPSSNVSGGWTMITSALEEPEDLFSEGGDAYAVGEFNVGELVTDYATDAGHPPEPYHFLLAFGIALIVILGVYGFTHKMGQKGSLSLAFFAGGLVLIIFYRFETIPGWTLIPYGLGAILLIMWRRTPSPVD